MEQLVEKLEKLIDISKHAAVKSRRAAEVIQLMDEYVMQAVYHKSKPLLSLKKLVNKVECAGRFHIFEHIFKMREFIPQDELFKIFEKLFTDRSNIYFQEIRNGETMEKFASNVHDPELLAILPLTSELLLDNPTVIYRYCQARKPGWEMLRYIFKRRAARQRLPEMMRNAVENDEVEIFMICKDMAGKRLSFSILAEIMEKKAFNIFRQLLARGEITRQVIPLEELCCCAAAQFPDEISVELLETIENVFPGTLKTVHDRWGRNLLWYAMHNRQTVWFHPYCKLTETLLKYGCDPENCNQLGIQWKYILANIGLQQKESIIARRSNPGFSSRNFYWPHYALVDKSYSPQWLRELVEQ